MEAKKTTTYITNINLAAGWDKELPFQLGPTTKKTSDIWNPTLFVGDKITVLAYLGMSIEWCADALKYLNPENEFLEGNWIKYPDDRQLIPKARLIVANFCKLLKAIRRHVFNMDEDVMLS